MTNGEARVLDQCLPWLIICTRFFFCKNILWISRMKVAKIEEYAKNIAILNLWMWTLKIFCCTVIVPFFTLRFKRYNLYWLIEPYAFFEIVNLFSDQKLTFLGLRIMLRILYGDFDFKNIHLETKLHFSYKHKCVPLYWASLKVHISRTKRILELSKGKSFHHFKSTLREEILANSLIRQIQCNLAEFILAIQEKFYIWWELSLTNVTDNPCSMKCFDKEKGPNWTNKKPFKNIIKFDRN